jgi:hypothetical protein
VDIAATVLKAVKVVGAELELSYYMIGHLVSRGAGPVVNAENVNKAIAAPISV